MVIWKYPIQPDATVSMPAGAKILSVALQGGQPCIWAEVDPHADKELRHFKTIATGQDFNPARLTYLGSFHGVEGWMVFHLFEDSSVVSS